MNEWIELNAPPLIIAIMGGVADYLMSDDHSITNMLVGIFLAGFAGYLVLLLCIEYKATEAMTGVICGISGMSSRAVLLLFKKAFIDRIKLHIKRD